MEIKTRKLCNHSNRIKMIKTWHELTVADYKNICNDRSYFNQLAILSGKNKNWLMNAPFTVVENLKRNFNWYFYEQMPVTNKFYIEIEGVKYFNDLSELQAGQYAVLQHYTINPESYPLFSKLDNAKAKKNAAKIEKYTNEINKLNEDWVNQNLSEIIAVLCKPVGVNYSDWNYEEFAKKVEKASIIQALGIVLFFLSIQKTFDKNMLKYLKEQKKEAIKLVWSKRQAQFGLKYFMNLPKTIFLITRLSLIRT